MNSSLFFPPLERLVLISLFPVLSHHFSVTVFPSRRIIAQDHHSYPTRKYPPIALPWDTSRFFSRTRGVRSHRRRAARLLIEPGDRPLLRFPEISMELDQANVAGRLPHPSVLPTEGGHISRLRGVRFFFHIVATRNPPK